MTRQTGGCQCGAVRYSVEIDLTKGGTTCNCSRCRRLGSVMGFAPRAAFTLEKGAGATTEFRFNSKEIGHRFCATCGIQCFAFGTMPDGTETVAINLNTLDGIDARQLKTRHVDGASM